MILQALSDQVIEYSFGEVVSILFEITKKRQMKQWFSESDFMQGFLSKLQPGSLSDLDLANLSETIVRHHNQNPIKKLVSEFEAELNMRKGKSAVLL